MKATTDDFRVIRPGDEVISMLTCYDAVTASILNEQNIDILLVGDSLGTNVMGYPNERHVTVHDIAHYTRVVRRGAPNAYILADLPYATYQSAEQAVETATTVRQSGADAVKVEGAIPEIITSIVEAGIAVCGHLGYTPQIDDKVGVKGRSVDTAVALLNASISLAQSGAFMLVLELIPEELAEEITRRITIPTIGIGSGRFTTGQVLVINDLIGLTERTLRHSARYGEVRATIAQAVAQHRDALHNRAFPDEQNSSHMEPGKLDDFLKRSEHTRP